jgi:hypothetical protein
MMHTLDLLVHHFVLMSLFSITNRASKGIFFFDLPSLTLFEYYDR